MIITEDLNLNNLYIRLILSALNSEHYYRIDRNMSTYGIKKPASKRLGISPKTLNKYIKNFNIIFLNNKYTIKH